MQLEQITIALRARNGWEAIDLGIRMAAHWALPLWSAWLCVFVPTAIALMVVFRDFPLLAWLIMWWLKPVFDRFALHVLSRAVFGRAPSLGETLAAWREILTPGLMGSLITRFYDLRRSFHLPIQQLERQRGGAARERAQLLGKRAGGHASALTLVFIQFEWVISIGIFGLMALFAPDVQLQPDSTIGAEDFFTMSDFAQIWALEDVVIYAVVVSLLEPFYVASGFALYLNRRVMLEGWDVELGIRRLAERQRAAVGGGLIGGIGAFVVSAMLLLGTPTRVLAVNADAQAQSIRAESSEEDAPTASANDDADAAKEKSKRTGSKDQGETYTPQDTAAFRAARKVISDPSFGSEREVERWKSRVESAPSRFNVQRPSGGFFGSLFAAVAEILRVLGWLAIALLVIWAIRLLLNFTRERASPELAPAPPQTLFGLAIAPDSLPDDVAVAARRALAQGLIRESLSLLYRGALSHLVHQRSQRIARGATEGDVLALANRVLAAEPAQLFEDLLAQWIEVAYAGRVPATHIVARLIDAYAQALQAPSMHPIDRAEQAQV